MDPKDAAAAYQSAWDEADEDARRETVASCWAEDGLYVDPTARAEGREALVTMISGFRKTFEGASIEPTTGTDAHDGYLRFGWRMVDANGAQLLEGVDFGSYNEEGQITSIIGFFGPWPDLDA